jgi:hypothetical protein
MNRPEPLHVTTHVARDLLQSADLFRHPERVVWEYVVNGLEYSDPGMAPKVEVHIRSNPRRLDIVDNGRGMNRSDLARFFTMHAENQDRASGKPGRGYFGTGKSAAFAIANTLRIETVRNNRRSVVELHRSDLEAASSGDPVPVREIEIEVEDAGPNGTRIAITEFRTTRINRGDIIKLIERNLRYLGRGVQVLVDGVEIEAHVPPIAETRTIEVANSGLVELDGRVLTLNVAKAPLLEQDRGVAILASGTLHEITLGTARGKAMSQFIFGEIDVPSLGTPFKGVAAFDMSRSGQLNPENEIVFALYAEVSRAVENLRSELVERENARKRAEQAAQLQSQANEIAKLINEDYAAYSKRFRPHQTPGGGGTDLRSGYSPSESGDDVFLHGGPDPAMPSAEDIVLDANTEQEVGPNSRDAQPRVDPSEADDTELTGHTEKRTPTKRHPRGGFNVQFRQNGPESQRAFYERETKTIYVNLDHPQVAAARGGHEVEEPAFKRLSYEIAFTEYAIGFAQEFANNNFYTDFDEPLFDIRDRIDHLARRASEIFRHDSLI